MATTTYSRHYEQNHSKQAPHHPRRQAAQTPPRQTVHPPRQAMYTPPRQPVQPQRQAAQTPPRHTLPHTPPRQTVHPPRAPRQAAQTPPRQAILPHTPPRQSYIFYRRPNTPPQAARQQKFSAELVNQVVHREYAQKKRSSDLQMLESMEQAQLAADIAAERKERVMKRFEQKESQRRALAAQVRTKSLPMPGREPFPTVPVFGKTDSTPETIAERRAKAQRVLHENLATSGLKQHNELLKRREKQQEEMQWLKYSSNKLQENRAGRYERWFRARRKIEADLRAAAAAKRARDEEERAYVKQPGALLHDQCKQHKRCTQCKRRDSNRGESNVWKNSQFPAGCRIMM